MSGCLSPDQLQRLLDGDAPDGAAEHVESCRACQQALERLTDAAALPSGSAADLAANSTVDNSEAPAEGGAQPGEEPNEEFLRRLEQQCFSESRADQLIRPEAPPPRIS